MIGVVLCSAPAGAENHLGSIGLTAAAGAEYVTGISATARSDRGGRIPLEIGATVGITDRLELRAAGRVSPGLVPSSELAFSWYGGIRNSVGVDQLKTFFDLDLALHATPFLTGGARVAFGVQYDVSPIAGLYALAGAQLGLGAALRLSFEVMVGVQFRTYVFD